MADSEPNSPVAELATSPTVGSDVDEDLMKEEDPAPMDEQVAEAVAHAQQVLQQQRKESGSSAEDGDLRADGPGSVPKLHEQLNVISSMKYANHPLIAGEAWYLLSMRWWDRWKEKVKLSMKAKMLAAQDGEEPDGPGPIDNAHLSAQGQPGELNEGAQEDRDFKPVPERVWRALHGWHGGGPEFRRLVVRRKGPREQLELEYRPYRLPVYVYGQADASQALAELTLSKFATVGELLQRICELLGKSRSELRVWDYFRRMRGNLIADAQSTLYEQRLLSTNELLVELKRADGRWPAVGSTTNTSYASTASSSSLPPAPTQPPGLCGLSNLGNTCFMNSGLQCLSNTIPLMRYFQRGDYHADLNPDNPLGMHGEIARAFADLLELMWSGHHGVVTPREFKYALERFAPQFSGFQQHDSQELLAFLLDGLHEDLNRIRNKPYVELKDHDGRPDAVVAAEMWDAYRRRNDSIVVDFFQGQLKSTLVCPECAKISVTFDPVMYVSLPLPIRETRWIRLVYVPEDRRRALVTLAVQVNKPGTIGDVRQAVAAALGVDSAAFALATVYANRFQRSPYVLEDGDDHAVIPELMTTLHAFEVRRTSPEDVLLPVLLLKERRVAASSYGPSSIRYTRDPIGLPMVLAVPPRLPAPALFDRVSLAVSPLLQRGRVWNLAMASSAGAMALDSTSHPLKKVDRLTDRMDTEEEDHHSDVHSSASSALPNSRKEDEEIIIIEEEEGKGVEEEEEEEEKRFRPRTDSPFRLRLLSTEWSDVDRLEDMEGDWTQAVANKLLLCLCCEPDAADGLLEAPREEPHESMAASTAYGGSRPEEVTLQDCFRSYIQPEQLGPDDLWYCSACKKHQQAMKKFDLWMAPPVLVCHLKRFSYRSRFSRVKMEHFIRCPLENLDLSEFVPQAHLADGPPPRYSLYAVSNHYGGMGSGHYTANARNAFTGKWYCFDDSRVSELLDPAQDVVTASAYVLFYIREDVAAQLAEDLLSSAARFAPPARY